jgi:BlaI family penicillinase repressor
MADTVPGTAVRHSILDLAPLELDCMNALWPLEEATVRDIQQALHPIRPRAYTTIMTILDRLAQKNIVQRRKSGRAWVYRANLTADEARSHALAQLVEGFFAGSSEGLVKHLAGQNSASAVTTSHRSLPQTAAPRPAPKPQTQPEVSRQVESGAPERKKTADQLDASLL